MQPIEGRLVVGSPDDRLAVGVHPQLVRLGKLDSPPSSMGQPRCSVALHVGLSGCSQSQVYAVEPASHILAIYLNLMPCS